METEDQTHEVLKTYFYYLIQSKVNNKYHDLNNIKYYK